MRTLGRLGVVVAIWLACSGSPALGGGKTNIEEGLPLTIESAYTIDYLGREVQLVTRYERDDDGSDSVRLEPRIEFGAWYNLELTAAFPFLLGESEPNGNRPIELEATYNINQETLDLPAFSVGAGVELPTGSDAEGVDPFVKLLVTRTLGRTSMFHQLHLNLAYHWNAERQEGERSGHYMAAIGYSTRLNVDTLLVADFVREQDIEDNVEHNIIEAGIRYQLLPHGIISAGVGFGIGDESPEVRVTVGFQYEF